MMENPSLSLIDQIKSKYTIKNIFSFIASNVARYGLTFGKKSLLDVSKPALAAITEKKFGIPDWPKYPDLVNNVSKDTFGAKGLADELNISNWPKYSETIYATVKFMANEICDDYAKKLNNIHDKFTEEVKNWSYQLKETKGYHDPLEKYMAIYFNQKVRPYIIKTVKYLKEHPKVGAKDINRWFNSLVFRIIYNVLGESLKDKVNEKNVLEESVLKRNINQTVLDMIKNCIFSNEWRNYSEDEKLIIKAQLNKKLWSVNSNSSNNVQYSKNFIANLYFWYTKMMFKETPDDDRKLKFNRETMDLRAFISSKGRWVKECFTGLWVDVKLDVESVNELLKKDSSFSFLFPNKEVDKKEQTSKEVPKQESKYREHE